MLDSTEKLVETTARQSGRADRRVWVRYSSERKGTCQPVPMPTAAQPEGQWGAQVRDISAGGVCLHLRRRFEIGTPLILEFPGVNGANWTVTVKVARVAAERGGWLIGCKMDAPLSNEDLKMLL
jgi:hypothetical protein